MSVRETQVQRDRPSWWAFALLAMSALSALTAAVLLGFEIGL
jgi:hypothetical protein